MSDYAAISSTPAITIVQCKYQLTSRKPITHAYMHGQLQHVQYVDITDQILFDYQCSAFLMILTTTLQIVRVDTIIHILICS